VPRFVKGKITIAAINIQIVRKGVTLKVDKLNRSHRTKTRETRKRKLDTGAFS
jgi:hypothetical protein